MLLHFESKRIDDCEYCVFLQVGNSPLHAACQANSKAMVKLLLRWLVLRVSIFILIFQTFIFHSDETNASGVC